MFNRSSLSFGGIVKYGMVLGQAKSMQSLTKKLKTVKMTLHCKCRHLRVYVSMAEDSAEF